MISPVAQALLSLAAAARTTADLAVGMALDVDNLDPDGMGPRIQAARELGMAALTVRRWRIIAELLAGADLDAVAEELDLSPLSVRATFGAAVDAMRAPVPAGQLNPQMLGDDTPGSRHDPDPWGTAEQLDGWLRRHADLVEVAEPGPVTWALLTLAEPDGKPQ